MTIANGTLSAKLVDVVGDRTAKVLETVFGYRTVSDLLHHYPRRYLVRGELSDIAELKEGDEVTVLAEVFSSSSRRLHGRKGSMLEVIVTDGSAKMSLTFFNQAWREKELRVGRQGLFAGKVGVFNNKRQLSHPDYEMVPDGSDVDGLVVLQHTLRNFACPLVVVRAFRASQWHGNSMLTSSPRILVGCSRGCNEDSVHI